MSERVRIFDTTLRDGEQSPGATMTLEEKLQVAEALHKYGRHKEVETLPIYGGQAYERQFRGLGDAITPGSAEDFAANAGDAVYFSNESAALSQDAKATLRGFIRRFPSSALINDARMKLADIQIHH